MFKRSITWMACAAVLLGTTACVSTGASDKLLKEGFEQAKADSDAQAKSKITEKTGRYVPKSIEIEEPDLRNTVSMRAQSVNLFQTIQSLAKKRVTPLLLRIWLTSIKGSMWIFAAWIQFKPFVKLHSLAGISRS